MPITTIEIAKICNVSQGTVDRALNGRPGISPATREKILKVLKEHNYTPHLIASSLSRGKSMTIGVVVFDLNNRYFSQMSNFINLIAHEHGYSTYLSVTEKNPETEIQILRNLASRRVDGLILVPISKGKEYISSLKSINIPTVVVGNNLDGFPFVSINDYKAAYDGTRYIVEAGYRQIVFVCPPLRKKGERGGKLNLYSQELRFRGFKHYISTVMDENPKFKYEVLFQKDFIESAISMVRSGKKRIAFFCSADVYALKLLKTFREQGISVPGDAGIMGFDNLDILEYVSPRLTTVSASVDMVGHEAMNMLFKLMNGETLEDNYYVPHTICSGETI
ncbi:LacI family transcriptional regulator [Spirochaetia bacterium]|nr:LacI family transcriptional regulator [Spirochaetia bacterium]